jgi:hypothetical protein
MESALPKSWVSWYPNRRNENRKRAAPDQRRTLRTIFQDRLLADTEAHMTSAACR